MREAELSLHRRLGVSQETILQVQTNLANTYQMLGRVEQALLMRRYVYAGKLKICGKEDISILTEANNLAHVLINQKHSPSSSLEEAKALLRKTMPVARRVLGEDDLNTLTMRRNYARALYKDEGATLDDLHEAVTTLEEAIRTARRVFGGAHPLTTTIWICLRNSRAVLRARETPRS